MEKAFNEIPINYFTHTNQQLSHKVNVHQGSRLQRQDKDNKVTAIWATTAIMADREGYLFIPAMAAWLLMSLTHIEYKEK